MSPTKSESDPNPTSHAVRIADEISEGIKTGLYSPGHRLVEAELTREFGVSRSTVREALGRLSAEGLVESAPHKGASVRKLTREDVAQLFVAREIIEGGVARLAAERIDEGDNRRLLSEQLAESDRWENSDDPVGYGDANESFHRAIVEIAGNELLLNVLAQLQIQAQRVLFMRLLARSNMLESIAQHREIAAAIFARDPAAAEAAMRAHISRTAAAVLATGRFAQDPRGT